MAEYRRRFAGTVLTAGAVEGSYRAGVRVLYADGGIAGAVAFRRALVFECLG